MKQLIQSVAVLMLAVVWALSGSSMVRAQVSAQSLKSISIPDKVTTSIGPLDFFDGVPTDATIQKVYDNLDRARALEVYLGNLGAVSEYSVLAGLAEQGANAPNKIAVFEKLMDSQALVVTANTSTMYAYTGTDLANDGPTVIEIPAGMLGFLDDAWQRFVGNIGVTGPDKGKGGKYLVIPPGYNGKVPDGYFPLKPRPIGILSSCAARSRTAWSRRCRTLHRGCGYIR